MDYDPTTDEVTVTLGPASDDDGGVWVHKAMSGLAHFRLPTTTVEVPPRVPVGQFFRHAHFPVKSTVRVIIRQPTHAADPPDWMEVLSVNHAFGGVATLDLRLEPPLIPTVIPWEGKYRTFHGRRETIVGTVSARRLLLTVDNWPAAPDLTGFLRRVQAVAKKTHTVYIGARGVPGALDAIERALSVRNGVPPSLRPCALYVSVSDASPVDQARMAVIALAANVRFSVFGWVPGTNAVPDAPPCKTVDPPPDTPVDQWFEPSFDWRPHMLSQTEAVNTLVDWVSVNRRLIDGTVRPSGMRMDYDTGTDTVTLTLDAKTSESPVWIEAVTAKVAWFNAGTTVVVIPPRSPVGHFFRYARFPTNATVRVIVQPPAHPDAYWMDALAANQRYDGVATLDLRLEPPVSFILSTDDASAVESMIPWERERRRKDGGWEASVWSVTTRRLLLSVDGWRAPNLYGFARRVYAVAKQTHIVYVGLREVPNALDEIEGAISVRTESQTPESRVARDLRPCAIYVSVDEAAASTASDRMSRIADAAWFSVFRWVDGIDDVPVKPPVSCSSLLEAIPEKGLDLVNARVCVVGEKKHTPDCRLPPRPKAPKTSKHRRPLRIQYPPHRTEGCGV